MSESSGLQKTTINRKWLVKFVVFLIASLALTGWFALDGAVIWPNRGKEHARFMLLDYLNAAEQAGRLPASGVADPAAEFAALKQREASTLTPLEQQKLTWFTSLSRVYGSSLAALTRENDEMQARPVGEREDTTTWFVDPSATRARLDQELAGRSAPRPLSATDIGSQWLFGAVAGLVSLFIAYRLIRTAMVTYRYDPAEHRLVLPDGTSIVPADIEVVDKRLWHKFYVDFKLKSQREVRLDVLRFVPLEEWVLEMEKLTDSYEPEADEAAADGAPAHGSADVDLAEGGRSDA